MSALGKSAGSADGFVDKMAKTAQKSNTTVSMLGEAILTVGGTANYLKGGVTELDTALGLLANTGIKGAEGGTKLRNIILSLASPTDKAKKALQELGVSVTDESGNLRSLNDIFGDLNKSLKGMGSADKAATLKKIFNKADLKGVNSLMKQSGKAFNNLSKEIDGAQGTAKKMSDTMQNNLGGQITKLKSALSEAGISIGKALLPVIKKLVGFIQDLTEKFNKLSPSAKNTILIIAGIAAAIGPLLIIIGKLTSAVGTIISTVSSLSNPVGITIGVLGVLAGVIAGVISVTNHMSSAEVELDRKMEESTEKIKTLKDEMVQAKEERDRFYEGNMSEVSSQQELWKELQTIVEKNGEIKQGYQDRADFITGQLQEAFGIEVKTVGGVIENYDALKDKMDELIEKKKAKILLESQEKSYKQALDTQAEATRALSEAQSEYDEKLKMVNQEYGDAASLFTEYSRAEMEYEKSGGGQAQKSELDKIQERMDKRNEELAQYKQNLDDAKVAVGENTFAISQYESNMQLFHERKYDEMSNTKWEFVQQLGEAGASEKATLEAQLQEQKDHLSQLKEVGKEYSAVSIKTQKKQTKDTIKELQTRLDEIDKAEKAGAKKPALVWREGMGETISAVTGKKVEFKKAANGHIEMYVDGVKAAEKKSKKAMAKLVDKTLREITKNSPSARKATEDFIKGCNEGLSNEDLQNMCFATISKYGNDMIKTLRKSLEEKSPSKAAERAGKDFAKGTPIGVKKEQPKANKVIKKAGESVVKAYVEGITSSVKNNSGNVGKSAEQLANLYISAARTKVSTLRNSNKLTLRDEISFWRAIRAQCVKGSTGYMTAVNEIAKAKKNYLNESKKINKDYDSDVKSLKKSLVSDIKAVTDKYSDAVKSRKEAITSSLNLDKALTVNSKVTKESLTEILSNQVEKLKEWDSTLDRLRNREGMSKGLLSDLEEMGVENLDTIKSFAEMTDEELAAYVKLYNKRNKIALDRSETENAELEKSTKKQINKLISTANTKLDKLEAAYNKKLKKIGASTRDTSVSIGKNIVKGLIKGVKSSDKSFQAYLTAFFGSISSNAKSALKTGKTSTIEKQLGTKTNIPKSKDVNSLSAPAAAQTDNSSIDILTEVVAKLSEKIDKMKIILDDGTLVGVMSTKMDTKFSDIAARELRGMS
jgi:TP901 family phage tail tape measure protein